MASNPPMASSSVHQSSTNAEPQPPPQLRPSNAIQHGADRLVELIEHEKSSVASLYHGAMKGMEANHKKYRENSDVMLRSIERKIEKRDGKINELQTELHMTRQLALDSVSELDKLKKEHEALQASLTDVGLLYVDGRLCFNEDVSRIVDEFVHGVRVQQNALASSRLVPMPSSSASRDEDDLLSGPIGPSEFFKVLATVLNRARRFAESLGKQRQQERDLYTAGIQSTQRQGPAWMSYLK